MKLIWFIILRSPCRNEEKLAFDTFWSIRSSEYRERPDLKLCKQDLDDNHAYVLRKLAEQNKLPENPERKAKIKFEETAVAILLESWKYKPFPTENEKADLAAQTGLSLPQINNWFINRRKRARYDSWLSGELEVSRSAPTTFQGWVISSSCLKKVHLEILLSFSLIPL